MKTKVLNTPIRDEDILDLTIGDMIYLNGDMVTGRDDVHQRVVLGGKELPVDLRGGALFHAGPIMRERDKEPGRYDVISIGPTTSMRMESTEDAFMAATGVKLIVGKGGMGDRTNEGCKANKVIHAVFPGGCAVLAAGQVEEVLGVDWLDLGMPEALWQLRVAQFGPLIVTIDTKGNNLFERNKKIFNEKKESAIAEINTHLHYHE